MIFNYKAVNRRHSLLVAIFFALVRITPAVHAASYEFTNNNGIEIRDGNAAIPNPSVITISGLPPLTVKSVKIRINGFSHNWPKDVDVIIKAPSGKNIPLFSDVGGSIAASNVDMVFSDTAPTFIPTAGPLLSTNYRPFDFNDGGVLDIWTNNPTFPIEDRVSNLNSLALANYWGDWKLYIWDDEAAIAGSIASWSILIETMPAPLVTARSGHTATLLPSGKILVAGGIGAGGLLASAELFDPSTGKWTATGTLGLARQGHTATALPNGTVLITGGENGVSIASAELYDPVAGTWSTTASLSTARNQHTATLLKTGQVLVTGGWSASGLSLTSSELYDPGTGLWSPTAGALGTRRTAHSATLLPNGEVLVAGGYDTGIFSPVSSSELFDPVSRTWSPTAGGMGTVRQLHSATLLLNGKVLVAGGNNNISGNLSSTEEYNPATKTWSAAGSLANSRSRHTASLLPIGKILVTGGATSASAEIYDSGSRTWSTHTYKAAGTRSSHTATLLTNGQVLIAGGEFDGAALADTELTGAPFTDSWQNSITNLIAARIDHTATTLPDGSVLVAGGRVTNPASALTSAEKFNAASSTWSATGSMNTARYDHTATLLRDGKVLTTGGRNFLGQGLITSELYDPDLSSWALTGSMLEPRHGHTTTLLRDGKVLAVAGYKAGVIYLNHAELYDPGTGTWSAADPLDAGRQDHTATLLLDGRVLVAGGNDGSAINSVEIYDPAGNGGAGLWTTVAPLIVARYWHSATLLPDGQVLVAGGYNTGYLTSAEVYDPASNTWRSVGKLNSARAFHAAALMLDGGVLVAGGASPVSAEIYDPALETWRTVASPVTFFNLSTATLLTNGKILSAGGGDSVGATTSLLYDRGLVASPSWRPVISSASVDPAKKLLLTGLRFRGLSGASGGGSGTQVSPTNYPVVQWRNIATEQVFFLQPSKSEPYTDTGFTSVPLNLDPGYAMVTVFVNGIPSESVMVSFQPAPAGAVCAPGGNRGVVDIPLLIDVSSRFVGPITTFAATGLPASMAIGVNDGIIGGTPLAGDVAGSPYPIHVTADASFIDFKLTIDATNEVIFYADLESNCILPSP